MIMKSLQILDDLPDRYLMPVVFFFSFMCVLVSEGLVYFLTYRNKEIRGLSDNVIKIKDQLNKEISKKDNSNYKDIENLLADFQQKTSTLSSKMIIGNLAPLPILFGMIFFVIKGSKNRAVGYLPFEPHYIIKLILQQGLIDSAPNAIGISFWYFFCMAVNRVIVNQFIPKIYQPGLRDLNLINNRLKKC